MMIQQLRTCRQKDHDNKLVDNLCVDPTCQISRFMCSKCIKDEVHKHNSNNKQNILDEKEFNEYVKRAIGQKKSNIKLNQKLYNNLINQISTIIVHLKNLISELNQWFLTDNIVKQLDEYQNKAQQGFNIIDEHIVNRLIKFNKINQHENIIGHIQKYSQIIIQNVQELQKWGNSLKNYPQEKEIIQNEMNNKYKLIKIFESNSYINTAAISQDLKYIVGGVYSQLNVWNYQDYKLKQSIKFDEKILHCKFTQDSKYLYVCTMKFLYQLEINTQISENLSNFVPYYSEIVNLVFISNFQLITIHEDQKIAKCNFHPKKEIIHLYSHGNRCSLSLVGLDYDKSLNMVASGIDSIILWNFEQGFQILEQKMDKQNEGIKFVLFIKNKQQLISSNYKGILMIWQISQEEEKLYGRYLIEYPTGIYNISLAQKDELIIIVCKDQVKIHTIKGDFIFQLSHYIERLNYSNLVQIESMKSIIVLGEKKLKICQLKSGNLK